MVIGIQPSVKTALEERAVRDGLTLSAYVRRLLTRALNTKYPPPEMTGGRFDG